MSDWGKIAGGIFLGPMGAAIGSEIFDKKKEAPTPSTATVNDPSAAIAESENQLKTAQIQADVMAFGIQENSRTSQFQTLAWVTDRLDSEETKLQIAVVEAKTQFTQESNRHIEKMTEYRNKFGSHETDGGLPPPNED